MEKGYCIGVNDCLKFGKPETLWYVSIQHSNLKGWRSSARRLQRTGSIHSYNTGRASRFRQDSSVPAYFSTPIQSTTLKQAHLSIDCAKQGHKRNCNRVDFDNHPISCVGQWGRDLPTVHSVAQGLGGERYRGEYRVWFHVKDIRKDWQEKMSNSWAQYHSKIWDYLIIHIGKWDSRWYKEEMKRYYQMPFKYYVHNTPSCWGIWLWGWKTILKLLSLRNEIQTVRRCVIWNEGGG